MLDTGNWVTPYVGGKPFLHKPPLVNWAIAVSFKIFGVRNEWTARAPSVLAMLALALTIGALGREGGWMKPETALVAALLALTQVASIEKGRLAEIEAIYPALSGIGLVLWLAWYAEDRSPWLLWTIPFVFFGLALLAKGPLHLVFFYIIAGCVLGETRDWRKALHPAHFVGLALMAGIFLVWFIPYHHDPATQGVAQKWQEQFIDRVTEKFDFKGWITNIPRGLCDHLPWVLLAPALWRRGLEKLGPRMTGVFCGVRMGVVVGFFGLLLIPGVLPRYVLPLSAPFALLLALALADDRLDPLPKLLRPWWRANQALAILLLIVACAAPVAYAIGKRREYLATRVGEFQWPIVGSAVAIALCLAIYLGRWKMARPALIATASAGVITAAMCIFASSGVPFYNRSDVLRAQANVINQSVPVGKTLVLCDPEYQPVIFYLQPPCVYALTMEEIPANAEWVLVRADKREKIQRLHPELALKHEFAAGKLQQLALLYRKS